MHLRLLAVVGFAFLICLSGLSNLNLSPQYAYAQGVAETATEASKQDQEVQAKVRGLLREIPAYKNVFVTVKGGVVTLKGLVLELEAVAKAEELAGKIEGVLTINNQIAVETSVEKRIAPVLERIQNRIGQFFSALPIVGLGLIIFGIVAVIGHFVTKMKYPWDAIMPNRFLGNLLRQIVYLGFLILGIVLALDVIGATALLSTILGAAGIVGLAIGFAVRDTVENYIASILLSFRQPFRPRDCVLIDGHEGYVIALTSRATILLTYDGNHVRIPNSTVFKGTIVNFTQNPERRFEFELGVEAEDLQEAIDLGLEVISDLSFVLEEPAPNGWISKIGDSTMVLWFGAWINQRDTSLSKARSEAIRKVKKAFEAKGIGLPEPIYRLRFDEMPGALSGQSKKAPQSKASKQPSAAKPLEVEEESDVSPDLEIERRLEIESDRAADNDLLDEAAPKEMD